MAFLIGGANSAADTGFSVDNSCRFNDDDDARIGLDFSGAGNLDTWTMSAWVKRCNLGANSSIFTCNGLGALAQKGTIRFDSTDKISCYVLFAGSAWHSITSSAVYRDTSAWYHIVVRCDTTQSTDTDRLRLYVNGTLQALSASAYPDQNEDTFFNEAEEHQIGSLIDETEDGDMYLAEFCWIDGTSYAPTSFGEFDDDSPTIWKPIDVSGLTFGTNGGYFEFKDSSDLGVNTKGNDWTPTNLAATDQATDTPTNSFCTMNPLTGSAVVYSEGNCVASFSAISGHWRSGALATMGVAAGKWYWEAKIITGSTLNITGVIRDTDAGFASGVVTGNLYTRNVNFFAGDGWIYKQDDADVEVDTIFGVWADDDIFSIALDMDNKKMWAARNGDWGVDNADGDPAAGSGEQIDSSNFTDGAFYIPCNSGNKAYTPSPVLAMNFGGCPGFAISSGNADGNGYGNFEYAPPSGFLALCTKNLGSDGG